MTRRLSRWFVACGVLGLSATAAAQTGPADPVPQIDQSNTGRAPAHISLVDGTAALYRDGGSEPAPSNMPVLAGDRIKTETGRVEVTFDDGSTLHLDERTTVDFESDSLVRLLEGRVRLSVAGPSRDLSYRIDAPAASAVILQPGEYRVAILPGTRTEEVELAVLRGAADLVTDAGRTSLRAGERAFASAQAAPSHAFAFNSAAWDAFDRWSETRRAARVNVSRQYLPDPVRPYGAAFDEYGAWQYDTSYGYVWYPRVSVSWRPYYNGHWRPLRPYGWTWIGGDPWAWPTHHYGRWGVSAGVYFWIPGATWGAAWVSWASGPSYVSWCALGWNNRPIVPLGGYGHHGDPWRAWTAVPHRQFGARGANVRAVAVRPAGAAAGGFVASPRGPDTRAYAVPRSATPIQSVGPGGAGPRADRPPRDSARAASASTSPVYTNQRSFDSRVPTTQSRAAVGSAAPRTTFQPSGSGISAVRPGVAGTTGTSPSQHQASPSYSINSGRTARPAGSGASTPYTAPRMQAMPRGDTRSYAPSFTTDMPSRSFYGTQMAAPGPRAPSVTAPAGGGIRNDLRPAPGPSPQAIERRGSAPDRQTGPPPSAGPASRPDGGGGGRTRPSGQPSQGGGAARPRGR